MLVGAEEAAGRTALRREREVRSRDSIAWRESCREAREGWE